MLPSGLLRNNSVVVVRPNATLTGARVGGELATQLKSGALPLSQVIMQSIASVGPAIAVFVTFQPGIGMAGINAPLVYLADIVIVLMLGSTLVHLSRAFPSAGGYFTYVSRTMSPRAGFIVSWVFVLYSALAPGVLLAYLGRMVSLTLAGYGVQLSWIFPFAAAAFLSAVIIYRGIDFSGLSLMIIGLMEIGIVIVFSLWGFIFPHDGSISFAPFNPHHTSVSSLGLAAVFGLFVYTGWESVAPVAEESDKPRRNIPIATVVSILFSGALVTTCTWGLILGWGTHDIAGILNDRGMPVITLAHRVWGPFWWLLLIAIANSAIGASIGMSIVSSRMWFAMGRTGALPKWFATTHPKYLTPLAGTWLQIALFFVVGLGGAAWFGIDNLYLVGSLIQVFAAIIIYIAANLGLTYYMWSRHRTDFRWTYHGFYPGVSSIVLLVVCYDSIIPLPPPPVLWAPLIVGVWILLGLLVIGTMHVMGKRQWPQPSAVARPDDESQTNSAIRELH